MSDFLHTTDLPEALLESLRGNNPFTCGAAEEPWHNRFPDIVSINQSPFKRILNLIQDKARHPRVPLAGVVFGEAGEGKTHLLRRILLACTKSETATLFVFVKPWIDSRRPFQHLLREIVLSLAEKGDDENRYSQFDRLVAEMIRDYVRYRVERNPTPLNVSSLEQFEANLFHIFSRGVSPAAMEIIEKEAVNFVHNQVPRTSREFLKVIFQYKDPEKRGLVINWLQGSEMDEEDYAALNVPSPVEYSEARIEQQAQDIILTLGILFTRYRLPMVICFDQLDSLIEPEQVAGFGRMIEFLVNHSESILPLAFVRNHSWNRLFQPNLDKAVTERLETNKIYLSSPTEEESKELVSRRIEDRFGTQAEETIAINNWLLPLLEKRLQVGGICSPRTVIRFANEIIHGISKPVDEPLPPSVEEVNGMIATEYKATCNAVATEFDKWVPESGYLQKAAQLFLKHQENVHSHTPGDDKYTSWTGTLSGPDGNDIPYACFVNKSKHWVTVLNALARAKAFLQEHPNGICTYIADERHNFKPSWEVTNERRREIEELGGNIVILDQTAVVRWYGLVSLSWKIGGGDILIGTRPASYEDLANFLQSGFSGFATEGLFDRLTKKHGVPLPPPPPPPPPVDEFISAATTCISQCIWPVLATDMLTIKLREAGMDVTHEWCLEQLGKNQHLFNLLPSLNGYIVKLVE